jgi:large subunit ribosomal protein L10
MNVQDKQALVDELVLKLRDAQGFYLTDFTGLNVKHVTDLRRRLREAGVEYLVVKNTLARRALEGMDLPDIGGFFTGPTGLVIGDTDALVAARVVDEFAREHDNKPAVKAGIVERRAVTAAEIQRIAKLPGREQLLAQLAGVLQAPLVELLMLLQAKQREFVGLLEALRGQRESA